MRASMRLLCIKSNNIKIKPNTTEKLKNIKHEYKEPLKNIKHEYKEPLKNIKHEYKEPFKYVQQDPITALFSIVYDIIVIITRTI
jgi:hypothetical protein